MREQFLQRLLRGDMLGDGMAGLKALGDDDPAGLLLVRPAVREPTADATDARALIAAALLDPVYQLK